MKKIIVILLFLFAVNLVAHEVSCNYSGFKAGDMFRYFNQTIIYAGIDTSKKIDESTQLAGINFKPIPAAFVKAEYQRSSLTVLDESLEFQIGFLF